jgi:tRNA pseudouridine13 synthase
MKALMSDFVVEELPLYEPSGAGTHTYFFIEKSGLNTMDAARILARALGKRPADAGYAGLKDAKAVTRQWISFEHVNKGLLLSDGKLQVLKVSSHGNKLKMGHLRGNRFTIRLRIPESPAVPSTPMTAAEPLRIPASSLDALQNRCREVLETLSRVGIPNYYGQQRFGRAGDNAALGRLLVQGKTDEFRAAYSGRQTPDRRLRNLLVNALQAELFNQILAARMPEIGKLQAGDLAWLHRNGAVFAIGTAEDAQREQPRADAFEISPSGPLFGAKVPLAEGAPGELERRVLTESGVTAAEFGRPEAERQPGARRPLRIGFLEPPAVALEADGVALSFALPPGAYATVVLREICGESTEDEG